MDSHLETLSLCNPRWVDIIKQNGFNFLADQRYMKARESIADINKQLARSAFSTDRVAVACLWDNSEKYFRFFSYTESTRKLTRLGMASEATPARFGVAPERLPLMTDFWSYNIDAKTKTPDELANMMGLLDDLEDAETERREDAAIERMGEMLEDNLVAAESGKLQHGRIYSYAAESTKSDPMARYLTGQHIDGMDPERIKRYVELAESEGASREQMAERIDKALKTKRPNTTLGRIVAGLEKKQ